MRARPIPAAVRRAVLERDQYCCQRCGRPIHAGVYSLQHRLPRGLGGTSLDPHTLDNLVTLCGSATTGCHGRVESYRAEAYAAGWLVERGRNPADVPVRRYGRTWSWLGESWRPVPAGAR